MDQKSGQGEETEYSRRIFKIIKFNKINISACSQINQEMSRQHRQLVVPDGVEDLPTEYSQRNCTDVCCLIAGLAFSIIMLIIAFATWSYQKFEKVNFPADSNGRLCGIEKAGYPYVYFVNPPQMERRVCVAECPQNPNQDLKCIPTDDSGCSFSSNSGFQVVYYQNQAVSTRSGHFCMPKDEQLRKQLLINSDLEARDSFYNSLDTIVLCFFVALGFSVLYFILVQFLPKIMNYVAVIVGCVIILATIICVFTYNTPQTGLKNLAGIILIIILIVILMTVLKNLDSWRMHAIFLKYSTYMIKKRLGTLAYIPIFFAILVCFVIIVVLQFTAYWTTGIITFDHTQSLYHTFTGFVPVLLSILLIIQTVWGLTFIKQAFNFCVSGQAVLWYYDQTSKGFVYPLKLLIFKHCGSVIAGSFMTGFLSFLDFVFDFLKPDQNANPDGCYTKFYGKACSCCTGIFDLVRSDSMAFINLTGNPFCNSSRYCEYLCDRSVIMDYSQSTSRAYRICAHFLIAGIMAIFALYVKGNISIYALLIIMVQSIFIGTLLISTHADATEAIQIIFLVDEEFARRRYQDEHGFDYHERNKNLEGLRLHEDLVNQVREQRQKQSQKRAKKSNQNASQ